MSPQIAAGCFAVGIASLFALNRDRTARTSVALWLPIVWLLIAGSRNASEWLQLSGPTDAADRYLEGSPFDRNLLTGLLLLAAGVLAQRSRRVGAVLRANAPLVVFFLYCGLSILWSDYPFVSFKRWIRGLGDVAMVLLILTERDSLSAIKRVLTRVAFLLLPISILLIRYYPELGRAYGRWDGSIFWTGVATGKNGLGMTCLIFGLACLWCFLVALRAQDEKRKWRLFANGAVVAMALWLLWIADSKTSLACFVLAGGLMSATFLSSYARRPAVIRTLVFLVVCASFAVLFLGVGQGALTAMGRDPTLTGRTDVWKLVLRFAADPLVGAGYESFWMGPRLTTISEINGGINQAHNGYIETYLNLGALGVTLLLVLLLTGYRRIIGAIRLDPRLSSLRIAYFVLAVVYNFTEGSFKMMSPVWITLLLATMAPPQLQPISAPAALDAAEADNPVNLSKVEHSPLVPAADATLPV